MEMIIREQSGEELSSSDEQDVLQDNGSCPTLEGEDEDGVGGGHIIYPDLVPIESGSSRSGHKRSGSGPQQLKPSSIPVPVLLRARPIQHLESLALLSMFFGVLWFLNQYPAAPYQLWWFM